MYVSDLALSDFRNYHEAVVALHDGVVTLVGANGQGKTNLVEAIAYLSTFSSHRVSADAALVRSGASGAVVRARVVAGGRSTLVELEIIAGRANRARVNRAPARTRDVLGVVRTVVFAPEDLALVKGDPSDRRRYLDDLVVTRTPRLAAVRSEYDRIVRQRSALLKSTGGGRRGSDTLLSTLDVWDGHLAEAGAQLIAARAELVAELTPHVAASYRIVSDGAGEATMGIRSSLARAEAAGGPEGDDGGSRETDGVDPDRDILGLTSRMIAAMQDLRRQEMDRGVCLVGPHRDDLVLSIGDLPAKGYASHGESWSLALALRMGAFDLLAAEEPEGETPILILDDVFAELDTRRRGRLADMVHRAQQVFVTAAVAEDIPEELTGQRLRVSGGMLEEMS
ncbi:MAG: DNA replication/repair protein RecF [Actinomycetota bacterium]